jgi:8-oxo-dGTP pyrophosphatase MutT (NUDIX family)
MIDGEEQSEGPGDWETLARENVLSCRIFTVEKVRRQSRDTGVAGEFYLIDSNDWVNVIALTDDREVVLIRQFRHGSGEVTLEIPGGILDDGESPLEAARRELLEETGYACDHVELLGRVRSNPALFNNSTYTVLATGLKLGPTRFDEHEEITIEHCPIERIDEMLCGGKITHALVVAAFQWYRLHCGQPGASL